MEAAIEAQSSSNLDMTQQGGKAKQTRRRQRLSCIECTKRRQRCDRQFPCGLCTTRGIPHLCRWEPIVVRPTPQRPPNAAINAAASATIEALTARIAALEQSLLQQQNCPPKDGSSAASGSSLSPPTSNEGTPDPGLELPPPSGAAHLDAEVEDDNDDGPRALIDYNVQVAAVALAQLSLAPRTEYVGNGTVVCAIHKLGDPDSWRFPHPATILTSPLSPAAPDISSHDRRTWEILSETMGGMEGNGLGMSSTMSPIRRLLSRLPSRPVFDGIVNSFFSERGWQFGIPERWFRSACQQMWDHLAMRCVPGCRSQGDCPACGEAINPHWLTFVFAVLALAPSSPSSPKDSGRYFMCSISARRFVEDVLLITPVYSTSEGSVNGSVLSCYSSVLHSMYLVDRGRISEAWKVIGNALRHAQALGMHRDPGWRKWEEMHAVDRELRTTSWWLLIICDRMWSLVLGRPAMAPRGSYDVMAMPSDLHADGTTNVTGTFYRVFVSLSDLILEAEDKCLGVHAPPYATVLDIDRRFGAWELSLPEQLRWRKPLSARGSPEVAAGAPLDTSSAAYRIGLYQRKTLAGWYLCGLMNIHRPYLMRAPPILPPPGSAPGPRTKLMLNQSRERCIEIALELTQEMCDFHDELAPWREPGVLNAETFSYFLFDGAVALAGALSQVPPHPQAQECLRLIDRAMRVLGEHADQAQGALDGEGEMAKRAIIVLKALRKAGGWDRRDEEKGELVLLQDVLMQAQQQQPQAQAQAPPQPSADANADFYSALGSQMPAAQYNAGYSMFVSPQTANPTTGSTASFIPYLNSSYSSVSNPSPFVNAPPAMPGPLRPFPSMPSSFMSDIDMSFGGLRTSADAGMTRPVQSMVMSFDVLQGVQPDSQQQMEDLDLDWARLAGMESWYSGNLSADQSGVSN